MNDFFGPGSPYLSHPLLTLERTVLEVDRLFELRTAHADAPTIDVLDVGCGFGRHAIELSRRGCNVVAIDPSSTMLSEAEGSAASADLDIEFVQSSGQHFARATAFDLVVSLFTSFGQIAHGETDDCASQVVANFARSLRPGGTLVIEVPERHRAVAGLVADETLGPTTVTRHFDERSSQVRESFATPTKTFDLAYRIYSSEELCALLEGFDLAVVDVVDEALVTPPTTFMTIVAERTR